MATKKPDEKIKELDEKIKQLQSQKQQFLNRYKEDERKKRTRNLIQIGGIMDNVGMKNLKQANAFKERLQSNPDFLNWFNSIMQELEEKDIDSEDTENTNSKNNN